MKPLVSCTLYTFIDSAYLHGREVGNIARELCEGGSDLVQLRAKDWPPEKIRSTALGILPILRDYDVGLVVNDHLDIASEIGADLCHLGQEDFFDSGHQHVSRIGIQAETFNREKESSVPGIGLSSHAPEQAERAIAAGAHYIAIGPVFPTGTKPMARPVTLDYVRWAAGNVRVPWFAIGGINLANVDSVIAAGANRICVVSAILNSPNIAAACREFRARLTIVPKL